MIECFRTGFWNKVEPHILKSGAPSYIWVADSTQASLVLQSLPDLILMGNLQLHFVGNGLLKYSNVILKL